MKFVLTLSLMMLSLSACVSEQGRHESPEEGVVWQSGADVETFWAKYLASKGGLTWPASNVYPDYEKVKEGDTFMVLLEQGPCLMEFFHNRWRRANDVWRWDESINDYGGCPFVFD